MQAQEQDTLCTLDREEAECQVLPSIRLQVFHSQKKTRLAKFEVKNYEGIFDGYASNSHSYRVLNKSTGCIEESSNVEFDEDNGSQAKPIVPSVVGDEAPSQVIRTMGICHILPQETPQVQVTKNG